MSQKVSEFEIQVAQQSGYAFEVTFDKSHYSRLRLDEPAPLGEDTGPNPSRLLAAAVADCLAASLLFCLQKQGVKSDGLTATVKVELVRNDDRRLRIGAIDVTLKPHLESDHPALTACLGTFEDYCVVTQSVRAGLDVRVHVTPTTA